MSERPDVRYADSDGVSIAYTRCGSGDHVVVYVGPWVSNVELAWDLAEEVRPRERSAIYTTTIEIDKRGVGCSDRTDRPPTLDDRIADTLAVLDAEGIERVSLVGVSEAAAAALALAARHPERSEKVVVVGPGLPGVPTEELRPYREPGDPEPYGIAPLRATMSTWGSDARPHVEHFFPSAVRDERVLARTARFQRLSASPGALRQHLESAMAARIEDPLDAVAFTDIVDSTATSSRMGDDAWERLVLAHNAVTARTVEEHGGRTVKSTGDGALVVFDDPERALDALAALVERVRQLGIEIRGGLHAGQVHEQDDGDVTGIAVNLAARIESLASPGQITVSRTIVDLLMGSDHTFESLGAHRLKGIAGDVEIHALTG